MSNVKPLSVRTGERVQAVADLDSVCLPCRAGRHEECNVALAGDLPDLQGCCDDGQYTLLAHLRQIERALFGDDDDRPAKHRKSSPFGVDPVAMQRGNPGYIHPDAWPSNRDIGSFEDVKSTGRKRVAEMYPITPGQVCDWARLKNCGGGVRPIVGCMGNPATDLHHGPDKNTLNNEKGSRGVGVQENVHAVCAFCHNLWHGLNDPFYPPYDRQNDQTKPWLPLSDEPWGPHMPEPASLEELMEAERLRSEKGRSDGKTTRGRNSKPRVDPDLTVRDE